MGEGGWILWVFLKQRLEKIHEGKHGQNCSTLGTDRVKNNPLNEKTVDGIGGTNCKSDIPGRWEVRRASVQMSRFPP